MIAIIGYINYQNELEHFDKELLDKMQLCNYSLDCQEFKIDFIEKAEQSTHILLKNNKEVSTLFPVEGANTYYLKLFYSQNDYHQQLTALYQNSLTNFFMWLFVIALLSILFSLYALYPLRKSLLLTREFVKDILHDFNTPISTMRLNRSLLQKEIGENKKLDRVERSIQKILFLQENLRDYLDFSKSKKETINLLEFISEQVNLFTNSYPNLNYHIEIKKDTFLKSDKKSLTRIIDNLLSNASKYNRTNGKVFIGFDETQKSLKIEDTGEGIQNPKRVFERFYKEHERGIGIGLHIVKKLCKELNIQIKIESKVGKGTVVWLLF